MSPELAPFVTVAIPTWNRLSYLRLAVNSALNQTYSNLEIVVSDNCSTDETAQYLGSIHDERLTVLRQEVNLGMIGNWDACLSAAKGEYFILLSDDDLLDPGAVESLVGALQSAGDLEEVAFAYGRCWVVNKDGTSISLDAIAPECEKREDFVLGFFEKRREIRPCATLLRTSDIREFGGYRQGKVELAVDAIIWSRALKKRCLVTAPQTPVATYRVHNGNLSSARSIAVWQSDLSELSRFWIHELNRKPTAFRNRLLKATRKHQAWMISVTINQAARSYVDRIRLLKTYYDCRQSFVGVPGIFNLAIGLLKLLVPESVKRPIRDLLIWKQAENRRTGLSRLH